jgi:hypothetical protein
LEGGGGEGGGVRRGGGGTRGAVSTSRGLLHRVTTAQDRRRESHKGEEQRKTTEDVSSRRRVSARPLRGRRWPEGDGRSWRPVAGGGTAEPRERRRRLRHGRRTSRLLSSRPCGTSGERARALLSASLPAEFFGAEKRGLVLRARARIADHQARSRPSAFFSLPLALQSAVCIRCPLFPQSRVFAPVSAIAPPPRQIARRPGAPAEISRIPVACLTCAYLGKGSKQNNAGE